MDISSIRGPVEEPPKMTSTGKLPVDPKILFHNAGSDTCKPTIIFIISVARTGTTIESNHKRLYLKA